MKKSKAFIAVLIVVFLVVSQCITSYASDSDENLEMVTEAVTAIENAEEPGDEAEAVGDKIITEVEGYDFLGDEPYQTLAAEYGSGLDKIPFPETISVSIEGQSEMVNLPVEWKLADGEKWNANDDVYDEDGNLITCKVVADFGEGYVLSSDLTENGAQMPWIKLIHQVKTVTETSRLARTAVAREALATTEQTEFVYYNTVWKTTAFEIKGVSGGTANIKTTYGENGYTCAVNVDGTITTSVAFGGNGITKTITNMEITQTLSIVNDGAYVKIQYDVYNPTTVPHTIGIVNHTDVQINTNDKAPIYPTGTGARMAESDTGSQFNIICKNAYGVTDVDVLWFGQYGDRTNHLWTGEQTTATVSGIDSGISMGWNNRVIQPGQTKTFSYLLGIGKSANPPELGSEISAVVNPQTVDVSASVKDVSGMTDKLYYVLDMNTEDESAPGVLDTKAGNGTFQDMGGTIQRPSTWQAGEVHTVSVWVMNDANAMSSIKTVAIYIEDNEEEGDVMRPAQSATLTFNANGGSGTAPSNMSVYELQTVSLPNNTFTAPAGMQFGGWQDTTGNVYPEGSDYKVPEDLPSNTMQFNAYWILTSESYYYLDVYEEQLNGSYKKTSATITKGTQNDPVTIDPADLTISEGFELNSELSTLSGIITNASNPLHLEVYLDRLELTVTFDDCISSTANDSVVVKYGATVDASDIKTLSNQTYADFGGWYTSMGGRGNELTTERKIKDNQTVYAYWIPQELNIDFDYNYTNPRANNLATREYSCKLSPVINSDYELYLAGQASAFPVEPARWQNTDGETFSFDGWYYGDTKVDADTLFNYEPISLTAHWSKVYAVVCVAEGGGTVSGQGFYDAGSDVNITWQADEGYHVSHVLIDGKWVGGDHAGEAAHLFENISENHNVYVIFEQDDEENPDYDFPDVITPESKYYLIQTQKYGTSKIELTDSFSVKEGDSARVEWSVPAGYKITKVLVNGVNRDQSVIDRGYVEIDTVIGNHTVDVYAEPVTNYVQQNGYYSISAAINHGTITDSASVTEGSDYVINWQVEDGYHAVSILIDGAEASDLSITSCTFDNITANHTVRVICEADDPSQADDDEKNLLVDTAIFGGPGSITPSSFVSTGDDATVTWDITADIPEQYEIGYVYIDGEVVELDEDNKLSYTFDDISNNHKVEVYLIPNLVQFNVTYEGKGSVSPSQTLLYATDYDLTATPADGWVLTSITLDGKQIYPEQPSLFSRIASFFSGRSNEPVALSDDKSFEQLYNVVETHNAEVVFSHEDGSTDTGNRIQLTTTLNGVGTISPSRLFVAERDGDEVIEWNVPDTYDVEGVYARVGDTAILTSVPATDNSVTINDILTALNIQESDYEFVTAIEFIVNTKPKATPTSVEPAKYNLTTSIDDGGNITSSMNNIEEGEVITVSWSTDETQWISKVIIDGVERPDLVEENSVDLTMDQDHSVEVKLNLAESTYYVDYYKQMIDGEYVLISSIPFASRVNTAVGINEEDISVPEGYGLNTDKSVISGTVTGASKPLHLSIYFDKYVDLVVEYVDEAGIAVADGYRETYKLLDSYKTEDAAPYGYELLATPDNASGKMTDEVVVVTYTYALKDTSVLVNYVDENGNKIPDSIIQSEEITGRVFDSYDTTAREIFGYDLIETPDNASGEMQEEQIVVNYVYRLKDTSVLLMFVNEDHEEISESRLIDGKVYDDYSEKAQDILDEVLTSDDAYGYELVEYPQLAYNGKMSEEQIVVVYNFKIKDTSVIVKHINESGEEIAPSATIEGKVFDAFDTNHLDDIYGYTFKDVKVERLSEQSLLRAVRSIGARFIALFAAEDEETTAPSDYSGTMEEDVIVVSYIYEIKDACVVVKYVDENGNELDSETISGKVFDDYNTEQKAIYAYEFVSSSDNTSGEMTEDEITVIYTYKQVLNIDTDGDGEPDINIDTDGDGEPDINIDTDDDGEPDINIDTDDDGKPDINIDTDDDGEPDINIDTDGDGEPDINIDTDDDGEPDVNIDTDDDGKPDINIDTTGDGKPNVNIDTTGDGKPDVNIDTTGDGKPNVNIDTTGDGKPNVNIDTTGDGQPNVNIDTTGDGKPNVNVDTDGDGEPDVNIDTTGDGKPNVNIDTTGDGKPNVNIDTDGDGEPDVNIDTTGDGQPNVNIDTTGDGKPNVNIDKDGDGVPDINIDTTGDGKPNVNIDTDGDGIPDLNIDTTGDGVADSNIDTDGDGIADKNIIGTVDTGSNDMFSIALFSSLAVLASVLLIIIRRKSKRVSE